MSALQQRLDPIPFYRTGAQAAVECHRPYQYDRSPNAPLRAGSSDAIAVCNWQRPVHRLTPLVYVVDECPGLADLARGILRSEGIPVRAFHNRVHAWQAFVFADPRPALMVVDDLGGDLPGIELIRRCRKLEPRLRTLWVTHRDPLSLPRSDRALVDGVQPRPYCTPLLVHTILRLCGPPEARW